jgi:hypothetical protein
MKFQSAFRDNTDQRDLIFGFKEREGRRFYFDLFSFSPTNLLVVLFFDKSTIEYYLSF